MALIQGELSAGSAGMSAIAPAESAESAVSWSAIIGGAFASGAVSLILIVLASGLGLASVSPWSADGPSATTVTAATGIGLIVVQWISSGFGGYITGRLRANWVGVHTHEVFFRDTAHGFLSWALAALVGVLLTASAASSLLGGGLRAASGAVGTAASGVAATVSPYDLDSLFRSDRSDATGNWRGEAARILSNGVTSGTIAQPDRDYLAQLIASHTGVSQQEAQHRVDDVIAREKAVEQKAREAAEAARKAGAEVSIFTALAMLVGAFIASAAAAFGGGSRDKYRPHA